MRYTLITTLSKLDCYYFTRHGEFPVRGTGLSHLQTLSHIHVTVSFYESRTSGDTIQYAGSGPIRNEMADIVQR
jgi:hypothetical protein